MQNIVNSITEANVNEVSTQIITIVNTKDENVNKDVKIA
jgi:hypothetical protein